MTVCVAVSTSTTTEVHEWRAFEPETLSSTTSVWTPPSVSESVSPSVSVSETPLTPEGVGAVGPEGVDAAGCKDPRSAEHVGVESAGADADGIAISAYVTANCGR